MRLNSFAAFALCSSASLLSQAVADEVNYVDDLASSAAVESATSPAVEKPTFTVTCPRKKRDNLDFSSR